MFGGKEGMLVTELEVEGCKGVKRFRRKKNA